MGVPHLPTSLQPRDVELRASTALLNAGDARTLVPFPSCPPTTHRGTVATGAAMAKVFVLGVVRLITTALVRSRSDTEEQHHHHRRSHLGGKTWGAKSVLGLEPTACVHTASARTVTHTPVGADWPMAVGVDQH